MSSNLPNEHTASGSQNSNRKALIDVTEVWKIYGTKVQIEVLRGVSLSINEAEVHPEDHVYMGEFLQSIQGISQVWPYDNL